MSRTWIGQVASQVAKHGKGRASWYAFWIEPGPPRKQRSKSHGPGERGRRAAKTHADKLSAQLSLGVYEPDAPEPDSPTWQDFRQRFAKWLESKRPATAEAYRYCLDAFEKVAKPYYVSSVTSLAIDEYVTERLKARGLEKGSKISLATIDKELRHVRAGMKKAKRWWPQIVVPEIEFLRPDEPEREYITEEQFRKLYDACGSLDETATPRELPEGITTTDWWRGLFVLAFFTGWRIGSILGLEWQNVDLENGVAVSPSKRNKGRKNLRVALHAAAVHHLAKLQSIEPMVFPFFQDRRHLWTQFQAIQMAAKVQPETKKWFGFHDFRRAFATYNAENLTPDALQALMGHADYTTTQRYIQIARQLKPATQKLHDPFGGKFNQPEQAAPDLRPESSNVR